MRDRVVCFTGHRLYTATDVAEARLAAALTAAWNDGYRTFISGMAPGFDLAAAEAVVRLAESCEDVTLIAAVPFAGQASGYSLLDRARYDALLERAKQVRVLADGYSHGCYFRRDDWMVDRAGRIVCWFDPSTGKSGGTHYTVRRALKQNLEIVNLFRAAGELF